MEEKRITVDGSTYQLRPWDYKDGRRWLYRLFVALSGAVGSGGTAMAVANVLSAIDEPTFDAFAETCDKYTDLVSVGEDGRERIQPLKTVAAVHLRRRYFAMASLMRAHVEAEFGDFFERAGELLAEPPIEGPAK